MKLISSLLLLTLWLLPASLHAEGGNENTGVAALKAYAVFKMGRYEESLSMWQKLSDAGNTTAMINLSNQYEQGLGTPRDLEKATFWLRKAADLGDPVAQLNLGLAYEQGLGVEKNNRTAAQYFRLASEQGDRDAQFNLGVMLATNYGSEEPADESTIQEARRWLTEAKNAQHPEAATFLKLLP
jgi:TPR repeat protein